MPLRAWGLAQPVEAAAQQWERVDPRHVARIVRGPAGRRLAGERRRSARTRPPRRRSCRRRTTSTHVAAFEELLQRVTRASRPCAVYQWGRAVRAAEPSYVLRIAHGRDARVTWSRNYSAADATTPLEAMDASWGPVRTTWYTSFVA